MTPTEADFSESMKGKVRVALIGLGSIGQSLVELIERDATSPLVVVGALVRDATRARSSALPIVESLAQLQRLEPQIVAEAAGHDAVRKWGPECLDASLPLVMLSVGALADRALEQKFRASAAARNLTVELPSGAVGGLDIIASASQGTVQRIVHTIVKPPQALGVEVNVRTEVFAGSARDAATRFPQNANVAAAVALAGIGLDRSQVVIVADPDATTNRSEVEVVGEFGRAFIVIDNRPSRLNPRSAAVVAMSLKHTLEKRRSALVIG